MEYTGKNILDLFSQFAINRNNFIASLIENKIIKNENKIQNILDFGAGKGEFLDRFKKENLLTYAVESDEEYFSLLSKKHNTFHDLDEAPGNIDLLFSIDVLEHIEEDEKILSQFFEKLNPGGLLFLYVPARMELYSEFDKSIGHFRRYNKEELKLKVQKAGFTIDRTQYHEMPGYFASMFHNVLLNKSQPSERSIRLYDKILPFSNKVEGFLNPPIGKSLYLWAIKP